MKMNAMLGIGDSLYFYSVIMCTPVTLSAHHELLSLNLPWGIYEVLSVPLALLRKSIAYIFIAISGSRKLVSLPLR